MRASRGGVIAETRELLVSAVVGAERSTALKAMCLECATTDGVESCVHVAGWK